MGVLTLSSYDNQAGGIFLSIPQFRKEFGFAYHGNYVLPANWQSAYSGGPTTSLDSHSSPPILSLANESRAVIGALGSSFLADKVGRKPIYLSAFAVMLIGITLETVATSNSLFFAGKFVNGFSVGAFGTVTMTYLGEARTVCLPWVKGALTYR